jgi:hypothetical protein
LILPNIFKPNYSAAPCQRSLVLNTVTTRSMTQKKWKKTEAFTSRSNSKAKGKRTWGFFQLMKNQSNELFKIIFIKNYMESNTFNNELSADFRKRQKKTKQDQENLK